MPHLTNIELDSLRHLIGCCELGAKKLGQYAEEARNGQLRDWCRRQSAWAEEAKQQLASFLTEGGTLQ